MLPMWRALHSFLADSPTRASARPRPARFFTKDTGDQTPRRTLVIALLVSQYDREMLAAIAGQEHLDIHFAESRADAWDAMNRLNSPLILYDRDWPNADWRTTVRTFASSPQRSCVILVSRVADDYLRQELIRRGGYDLLTKPFRADDVTRSLNLALSFWATARTAAPHSRA